MLGVFGSCEGLSVAGDTRAKQRTGKNTSTSQVKKGFTKSCQIISIFAVQ